MAAWQLRELRIAKSWVSDQVAGAGWDRIHVGVYRLPGVPDTPEGAIWAALLAVSPDGAPDRFEQLRGQGVPLQRALVRAVEAVAAVTGMTAAWVRGARTLPPDEPEILVPARLRVRRRGMRVVRGALESATVCWVRGTPCVGHGRMLWDIAWLYRSLPFAANMVGDVAVRLDRRRHFTIDETLATVKEPVAFGLSERVPRALREASEMLRPGFSHSRTEAIGREVALEIGSVLGIELTPRPYPIVHEGRIIAEADIAAPALRWDAEIDGPHHDEPSVRASDATRDRKVGQIDWLVARYPHTLIDGAIAEYRRRFTRDLQDVADARS